MKHILRRMILISAALLLCTYSCTIAQTKDLRVYDQLDFAKYTSHDGLSNSHVNSIGQDKNGFIWVATDDGLNRLDGLHIETYHHSDSDSSTINSNTVFTVFTDNKQQVWFGTFAGICRYDYENGCFVRYSLPQQPNVIKYVPVKDIAQTKNDDLWLATSGGGLAHISARNHNVAYFRHDDMNPANTMVSDYLQLIVVDDEDNLWLGSENMGLSIFNPSTNRCRNIDEESGEIASNIITSLYKSRDGRVWIGTYEGGVTEYNPKTDTFVTHLLADKGVSVYGITEDKNGKIWIGTQEKGLFVYDGNAFKNYSNAIGNTTNLISDNIRVLFTDKESMLWLGIFQGGVNMLKPEPLFGGIGSDDDKSGNGISQKPVLSIWPDSKETVYLGTDGDGVNIWNTVTNHVQHIRAGERGLKSNIIRHIYKDRDGRIWMGTFLKGLQEFDPKTQTFTGYENIPNDTTSLSHNDVTCIAEDHLGNLWVGTNGGGLNLLDKSTGKFKRFSKGLSGQEGHSIVNNYITSLYPDKHGYLWVCTFWGLTRLDPVTGMVHNIDLEDRHNTYFCCFEDSKNRFWTGTTNGLRLVDVSDGSFMSISTKDGLPNNRINGISEDSNGNLWLSTNRGICKFNYDSMSFTNFFTEDGLVSNEFIHNSIATDTDGEIYLGSVDGITQFYPDKIITETTPPRVTISDLLVFNKKVIPDDNSGILQKSITETDAIRLQWQHNSFTIVYQGIEYIQPQKVKYASRMRGFDNEWHYYNYNQTSASYTNLDAGIYYFEVKATTDGKSWSEPVVLKVRIIAPVWRRWWAIAAYIIIVMVAIHLLWRYYRRTEQEKQQAKLQYIKQQNDIELNKTRLQLFTNVSHEIRTPLTLLISPLEQMVESGKYDSETMKQLTLMHRNAQRLLRIVNQIMDIRKIDNDKLLFAPVKGDLVIFTREVYENFVQFATNNNISLSFNSELQEYSAYFDPEIIDKALYNLLSNAIKFTQPNGKVEVNIRRADAGNITIIIEDSGRGIASENIDKIFDRYFQGDTSSVQQGTGIGLWLTKEYVKLHQGSINVSSELGKGATFAITLTDGEAFKELSKDSSAYRHQSADAFVDHDSLALNPPVGAEPSQDIMQPDAPEMDRYTLLIVEDNADIRDYLQEHLSAQYNVKTAVNGIEGLEIAKSTMPDLVITDVAMPEMNGTDLCRKLKTDIDTCHIPVIMLTAKSSEQQRIEGLETGADSYITKPFNPRHLHVRIEKLLELRVALRDKFSNEIGFKAIQTAVTSTDRDLLKKVTETIQKRISDTSLSVETLAEDVALSRGHLQRKLKNLTGQNPNEFIRIIRLKYAAEVLAKHQDLSIAEVSEMVGFNSQSYFSTAFTKQFNISPSQYKEGQGG
ncbi:MAG: response regulator [Bacteroidales bacterium]|nr:response regulator [Bacteroidales bacterium]